MAVPDGSLETFGDYLGNTARLRRCERAASLAKFGRARDPWRNPRLVILSPGPEMPRFRRRIQGWRALYLTGPREPDTTWIKAGFLPRANREDGPMKFKLHRCLFSSLELRLSPPYWRGTTKRLIGLKSSSSSSYCNYLRIN